MIPINRTYAPLQAFVEELYRCGMRHAVTSPGSRNAPLALTLAAQEGVEAVSVLDERSAGFVALGMAKASGRPVAVTCTSGTAAANLHPAVVEAHEARVPLIVLTGDRPPELREVGAGTVDRPDQAVRHRRQVVRGGGHPRPRPRHGHPPPRPRLPRLLDRRRRPPGPGAPELPAAGAARARSRRSSTPPTGRAARTAAPGPSCASTPAPPTRRRPRGGRPNRRRAARADRVRALSRGCRGGRVPAGGRGRLADARGADLRACAAATTTART